MFPQFGQSDVPAPSLQIVVPRLVVVRPGRLAQFTSSLRVLLGGPASPKQFLGGPYFRDCWIEPQFPKFAFAFAIVCQLLLVKFPPPIWKLQPVRSESVLEHTQLTWYGPINDFPAMLPQRRKLQPARPKEVSRSQSHRGADAFHPRQTIISAPLHPTHPRQTLVQPAAPPEPPKILPALPNIVELAKSGPAKPKLQLTPEQLLAMKPKASAAQLTHDAAVPEVAMQDKTIGSINIAASDQAPPKPVLQIHPISAPRQTASLRDANTAAPEIAQGNDTRTLIALSAAPAPVAPPASAPGGNLSARVAISPEGVQPGSAGGTTGGVASPAPSPSGGGGHGPEGIFISGGSKANAGSNSALGIGAASRAAGLSLPSRPVPRRDSTTVSPTVAESGPAVVGPKLGLAPDVVLGSKRVYTLHVNMPNMTSAAGSWVLNFAELNEMDADFRQKPAGEELAAPVPLRKVDPKYPPELRTGHVEGEVILYAVIRKDGSVDSIQLVHSVDPGLDTNAIQALAQWKFRPAQKGGEPVELEAVVHIPFRSRAPQL
jgi:TonB family protein